MKKIIALLLAMIMCLGLMACGNPGEQKDQDSSATESADDDTLESGQAVNSISLGDSIQNDKFTMTFESMDILPEYSYRTSEYSSTALYVETGYKLLLISGHFENTSTAPISDSSFAINATVNGEYKVGGFDVRLNFIRDKYFEIDPYTDFDYVLYINIPEKLADIFESAEFTIGFNDDMSTPEYIVDSDGTEAVQTDNTYSLTVGLGTADASAASEGKSPAEESKNNVIEIGDTISSEDFDFTLNNVELTYELKPANTSNFYTSYEAPDGKVYIHVDGTYYNKSKRDICIRDLFTPYADYDDGYTYGGFVVTDEDDNSFDWVSSYVVCTPLETCHYHGLIECPGVIDGSDASLVVSMVIGGETYSFTIR